VEVVSEKAHTLATEGNASPRKPYVATDPMSLAARILLVACLRTLSLASSSLMPEPSSLTSQTLAAAVGHLHLYALRTGVRGVLRELLDHGGGAVDDLPGGDLLRHEGVE